MLFDRLSVMDRRAVWKVSEKDTFFFVMPSVYYFKTSGQSGKPVDILNFEDVFAYSDFKDMTL